MLAILLSYNIIFYYAKKTLRNIFLEERSFYLQSDLSPYKLFEYVINVAPNQSVTSCCFLFSSAERSKVIFHRSSSEVVCFEIFI